MYVNNTEQQAVALNCDGSTFSCSTTLVDLGAYILHNIEVSCSTRVGEGPRANKITVRTFIGSEFRVVIITCIPTQRHKLYCLDTKLVDTIINSYTKSTKHYHIQYLAVSARNNGQPLAIFRPISAFC